MPNEFKVGDLVWCLRGSSLDYLQLGDAYEIIGVDQSSVALQINDNLSGSYDSDRFAPTGFRRLPVPPMVVDYWMPQIMYSCRQDDRVGVHGVVFQSALQQWWACDWAKDHVFDRLKDALMEARRLYDLKPIAPAVEPDLTLWDHLQSSS